MCYFCPHKTYIFLYLPTLIFQTYNIPQVSLYIYIKIHLIKKNITNYHIVSRCIFYLIWPPNHTHGDVQMFTSTFQEISYATYKSMTSGKLSLSQFPYLLIGDNSTYLWQTLFIAYATTLSSFFKFWSADFVLLATQHAQIS